ncbi:MAG TPA: hypothetical protein VFR21_02010 [Bradyrhizobium sp.]|jgi:hypothetical protein|nr:hypothetical protein [Bradyrhizobium sp.]
MSTDLSIRPVGSPAPTPVVFPASQAVSSAVQTVLPPGQAVTASDPSDSVRSDQEHAANDVNVAHQAYYDRSAEAIVFQVINQRTDQVVDQYPDEAVLRRRAYFHSLDLQTEHPRVIATDRTA